MEWLVLMLVEGALDLSLLSDRGAAEEIQVKCSLEGALSLELSRLPLLPLKLKEEGVGKRLLHWRWWDWASWALMLLGCRMACTLA